MKEKKIFKKWWFWLVVVIVILGVIGALGQSNNPTDSVINTQESSGNTSTLPVLSVEDYKEKEGLVVYKDLKAKGYNVEATFENSALTDINGKATDLFEPLDLNNTEDRQSVDAFIVGNLQQDGENVILTITKSSN